MKPYRNVAAILQLYLLALVVFSMFRVLLFLTELSRLDNTATIGDIMIALLQGVRFDVVIAGYVLLIPGILITLSYPFLSSTMHRLALTARWTTHLAFILALVLLSIAALVCAADIPFFNQFFARFNVMAFEWAGTPMFVAGMIIQEPRYWLAIIPFIVAVVAIAYGTRRIQSSLFQRVKPVQTWWLYSIVSVLFVLVMTLGIRGRIDVKSPIRVGTAYFCNNQLLNQLGLNPVFTLVRSVLDAQKAESRYLELMDDARAIAMVQQQLGIVHASASRPLLRTIVPSSPIHRKHNVVIVLMESMSAAKMSRHGCKENLTPFLDSLSKEGLYFDNAYSAATHTRNGIFSTLCSFPALYGKKPMAENNLDRYSGIASTLKNHGYSSTFFMTHDGQFDNVEGFLMANDFQRVVTSHDHASADVKTVMGVPDDILFRKAIPTLTDLQNQGKPFLAVFMTGSDHGPYFVPEYFKPLNKNIKKQVTEYADWSLRQFISLAKNESWFANTIFVFVADHGAPITSAYEVSLDYNHVPLLFYAPEIIDKKQVLHHMACQIDVFPTIMGLLNLPYNNNTLGIDLLREQRPYAYFCADDTYGVVDSSWLYVAKQGQTGKLYRYQHRDAADYASSYPHVVKQMRNYVESNMQAYQYILRKKAM